MGKPTKRPRLASKAAAVKTSATNPFTPSVKPAQIESVLRTKDGKRQAKHAAFLKKIHEKSSTKRKRPKKKLSVSLLSLGDTLDDIMAKDRELRSRKMEISVRPKGKEIDKEIERFKAVMKHPEFKVNPFKAIRQHVENTWERKEGMAL